MRHAVVITVAGAVLVAGVALPMAHAEEGSRRSNGSASIGFRPR